MQFIYVILKKNHSKAEILSSQFMLGHCWCSIFMLQNPPEDTMQVCVCV